MVIIIIVNSLFITVLSSQVSEMHAMCWLDPIHSGLGLSNFGGREGDIRLQEIRLVGFDTKTRWMMDGVPE